MTPPLSSNANDIQQENKLQSSNNNECSRPSTEEINCTPTDKENTMMVGYDNNNNNNNNNQSTVKQISPDCVAGFDDELFSMEDMTPKKYDDLDSWINDMMKHSQPTPKSLKSKKNLQDEMNKERRSFFISKEDVNNQARTMVPLILKKHEENQKKIEEAARRMVPLILKEHAEIQRRDRDRKIRERFGRRIVRPAEEFYNDIEETASKTGAVVETL
jgi:hypothetical protein